LLLGVITSPPALPMVALALSTGAGVGVSVGVLLGVTV
jgi:hypothetical protein